MTIKEKKIWLSGYSSILRQIEALNKERKELDTLEQRIWNPSAAQRIREISELVKGKADNLVIARKEIESAIASLPDHKLREIISNRYILDLTWADVADTMMLDLRWVHRLHVKALNLIERPNVGGE